MDSATPSPTGLDPLTFSDDLQKVGLTQPQATTVARWWGKLATKEDLHRVKTHLSDKIGCVRKEMRDKFEKVYEKFGKVDEKFGKVDEKFEKVDEKFEKVYDKFEKVYDKVREGARQDRWRQQGVACQDRCWQQGIACQDR